MNILEADDSLVVSIPEAGRLIDMGRTSVYALIKDGDLKSVKIRNRHLVIRASIKHLVERLSGGRHD